MEKQKVCIIGGGLTGLVTAIALSRLNLEIDLVTGDNINKKVKSARTIALSQNNYDFLKKLKINNLLEKNFWPCDNMKLYAGNENEKFDEIFEINRNKKEQKQIFYMVKNSTLIKSLIKNIKKNKSINYQAQKKIYSIVNSGLLKSVKLKSKNNSKYNLIIVCTGAISNLVKNTLKDQFLNQSYKEFAITTILKHNSFKNNTARQIFLNNEILALLPISKTKTSIVWSVKKNTMNKYENSSNLFLKKKIKLYTKDFLKKIQFISNMEFKDLNFFIRKKYFYDRVLLFGDILHQVHPLTGQGFNMVLRDLSSLKKILRSKINLGLDIGSSDILTEFSKEVKPRNFAYSLGIDFIRNCFSIENKSFNLIRNKIIIKLNKNNLAKDIFYNIANTGFKF